MNFGGAGQPKFIEKYMTHLASLRSVNAYAGICSLGFTERFKQVSYFYQHTEIYCVELVSLSKEKNLNFLKQGDFNTDKNKKKNQPTFE